MYAHYFASRTRKYLVLSATPSPEYADGSRIELQVSGKAEARRIAKERGARCWNF